MDYHTSSRCTLLRLRGNLDVGRGVARIDYDSMDSLSASTGDVIEIRGKRRTVAKFLPLYPSDEGSRHAFQMNELITKNIKKNYASADY